MQLKYRARLRLMQVMLTFHNVIFPNTRFDLGSWQSHERGSPTKPSDCGYAACAVGSATAWLPFRLLGFIASPYNGVPVYRGNIAWDAVRKFFGVTQEQAAFLFDKYKYVSGSETTPQDVRARISLFLKTVY